MFQRPKSVDVSLHICKASISVAKQLTTFPVLDTLNKYVGKQKSDKQGSFNPFTIEMKPIILFTRPATIVYKHSVCSLAALLVLLLTIVTVLVPFYIAYGVNADLWMTQNQQRLEILQPDVRFAFRYIVLAEFESTSAGDDLAPMVLAEEEIVDQTDGGVDPYENGAENGDSHIRAFTSYSYLNELLGDQQRSVAIKVGALIPLFYYDL